MNLYERIKKRREYLNMSQDELARKLGYSSRSTIAKIESGTNDIPQSKINSFAKALQTTSAYLMGWEDEQKATPSDEGDLTAEQQKAMSLLDALPDDKKQEALRYLEYLVEKQDNE